MSADDPLKMHTPLLLLTDKRIIKRENCLAGMTEISEVIEEFFDFQNINYRIQIIQSPLWF